MKTELQTAILSGAMALGTAACAQSVADPAQEAIDPAFDIVEMGATSDGRLLTFAMAVAGRAGSVKPVPIGQLAGAKVQAYVWPTNMDPARVGFDPESGILALAITAHPDFDDTPLFDEDQDGDPANDGANWHSHWVVLTPNEACGAGALSVQDIPDGTNPKMPATWPGLPIYIDSPGFSPVLEAEEMTLIVAFADESTVETLSYDGVTSALRVNQNVHAPLLCVVDVFDVASGDLSLPGKLTGN